MSCLGLDSRELVSNNDKEEKIMLRKDHQGVNTGVQNILSLIATKNTNLEKSTNISCYLITLRLRFTNLFFHSKWSFMRRRASRSILLFALASTIAFVQARV